MGRHLRHGHRQVRDPLAGQHLAGSKLSRAVIADALASAELRPSQLEIYDRPIGVRLLYRDPDTEAEHYLIRYPGDLTARVHRHTAAQTIVVLDGRLTVNGAVIGPGSYCHFPAGEPMHHEVLTEPQGVKTRALERYDDPRVAIDIS